VKGTIKRADLSRERSEQRPDRFAVGEKVDAKVVGIDSKKKIVTLSIKQRELDEDKAAMAEFGSADSGASLGDILGAALKGSAPAEDKPKKKAAKKDAAEE
jgi:small subunit ribosomal protein S1